MRAALVLFVILTLCSCAANRNGLRYGDECKIETRNGEVIQGRFLKNDGDSLTVEFESRSAITDSISKSNCLVALNDITAVYSVENRGGKGLLIGVAAGTLAGIIIGNVATRNTKNLDCSEKPSTYLVGYRCRFEKAEKKVDYFFGGVFSGALAGWVIGMASPEFVQVSQDSLPCCDL